MRPAFAQLPGQAQADHTASDHQHVAGRHTVCVLIQNVSRTTGQAARPVSMESYKISSILANSPFETDNGGSKMMMLLSGLMSSPRSRAARAIRWPILASRG